MRISLTNQKTYLRNAIAQAVAQTGSNEVTIQEANGYLQQYMMPSGVGSYTPLSVDLLREGLKALIADGEIQMSEVSNSLIITNEFQTSMETEEASERPRREEAQSAYDFSEMHPRIRKKAE